MDEIETLSSKFVCPPYLDNHLTDFDQNCGELFWKDDKHILLKLSICKY